MSIFILHPGKANYPEIAAYKAYFSGRFIVSDGTPDDYASHPAKDEAILWCIMGFYPRRLEARHVIHDYRSLSTGKLAWLKDLVKAKANARPDLRIFQNEKMRDAMGFDDNVPTLLLPMGIPTWLADFEFDPQGLDGTYCYIGEMSVERGFDKLLDAFLAHNRPGETLLLVGEPEASLLQRYKDRCGLIFAGKMPQREALAAVARSKYAISYFPYHRPHLFQTPTKLLEYAAVGARILANDSPGNVDTAAQLGIEIGITGRSIFDDYVRFSQACAVPSVAIDARSISWDTAICQSGIGPVIDRMMRTAG